MNKANLPSFVRTLGDPHLGKKFTTGVPVHRRGDREKLVAETFQNSFKNLDEIKLHICVGDLFDKFRVPEEVILFAAQTYRNAAEYNPDTQFIVLRGNHDASRDTDFKSSFDVFTALVGSVENIFVVDNLVGLVSLEEETEFARGRLG